jgi:hypothetical protein
LHTTPTPSSACALSRVRRRVLAAGALAVAVAAAACGGSATAAGPTAGAAAAAPGASTSEAPGTGTTGDVPDNAVFLTYTDPSNGFSIQYVEGWQVASGSSGVVIRDKDSSEHVAIAALPPDLQAWVSGTDLKSLQSLAGFSLVAHDSLSVGPAVYEHIQYRALSAADPVTGKQVPTLVDRYYVPGASRLAVVTLSTPDGVDNVDAFRQMIGSFAWR